MSDQFVCRREGHVPTVTIAKVSGVNPKPKSYMTTCQRCGKVYEEVISPAALSGSVATAEEKP